MAVTTSKRTRKPAGSASRSSGTMSRGAKAAQGEIKQGVRHLERSIGEIQRGLRKAEKLIEADARARIRALQKDARSQLSLLEAKRREVSRTLKNVSVAAEGSWEEVKRSADAILADARGTAASVIDRLRKAITR